MADEEYTKKFLGLIIDQVLARQNSPEARKVIEKHGDFSIDGRSLMLVIHGVGQYVWRVNSGKVKYLGQEPVMATATVEMSENTFWALVRRRITPWEGMKHGLIVWKSVDGHTLYHAILLTEAVEDMRKVAGL